MININIFDRGNYFILCFSSFPSPSGTSDAIKEAAKHGHRGKNPARILKAIVDMMKERYLTKVYDPLSMDDVLKQIDLEELHSDVKKRLYEVRVR